MKSMIEILKKYRKIKKNIMKNLSHQRNWAWYIQFRIEYKCDENNKR